MWGDSPPSGTLKNQAAAYLDFSQRKFFLVLEALGGRFLLVRAVDHLRGGLRKDTEKARRNPARSINARSK